MQKVDGVQNVKVSLNEGLTILDLKAGNSVTLATLRQIIKNNGFVSKEALIVARGTSGRNEFDVSGTGEHLATSATPQPADGGAWRFTVPSSK
jgi:copper chaperone CopZ